MRFCASFSLDSADYITERFFMKCGGCVFCAPVEWPVPSRAIGRPVQRPGRAPGQNARWAESQLKPNYFTSETTSRAIYYSPPQGPLYIKKSYFRVYQCSGDGFNDERHLYLKIHTKAHWLLSGLSLIKI